MSSRRKWSNRLAEKRLLDYAYLCAEEALDPGFFDECAKMLAEDWNTIVGIIEYGPEGEFLCIHQSGLSSNALAAYKAHYYRTNLFALAIERLHLENITTNFDGYLSAADLHRSEYYNEFLRPIGVEHVLALGIGEGKARTSVTLYRDVSEAPFDRDEIRRFDLLRPFLRSALTIRGLAARRRAGAEPRDEQQREPERPRIPSRWNLTPRETEVALALAQGMSYKEVAFKLGISPHTVNDHVDSLHRKLNLSTAKIIAVLNRQSGSR